MEGTEYVPRRDPTKERVTRYLEVVNFGDPTTWQPFVHRLLDVLASETRRQKGAAGRRLETMDVVHDVLLSMIRYRDERQPTKTGPFKALIRALVRRRIIDRIRKDGRISKAQDAGRALESDIRINDGHSEDMSAIVASAYSAAMARCEGDPRFALKAQHLRLRIVEGRSVAEIAQRFGTTPENVRYHLRTGGEALLPIFDECLAERIP